VGVISIARIELEAQDLPLFQYLPTCAHHIYSFRIDRLDTSLDAFLEAPQFQQRHYLHSAASWLLF
jgi:hypothetical protein